ncbi:MAG TPA: hypothetical protein VIH82_00780 [Acidimicrobiia bacterium]
MIARRAVLVGTVLVAAVACSGGARDEVRRPRSTSTSSSSEPSSSTTAAPAPAPSATAIGTHAVGIRTTELVDASRPTPPNGGAPGSPVRTMPTTIWYPAVGDPTSAPVPDAPGDGAAGSYPLVVFAHGFNNTPGSYADLMTRWASAGYVVVAPAIPLLNADAPGGPSHADYGAANIADMAFVVDQAIHRAGTSGDELELADPRHVAVSGHSDGEVLAYALALEPCCHDERVGAAVLLAGNLDNARVLPAPTGVPVLHVMSERDEYNPYAASIAFDRAHLPAPSYSLTLLAAPHGAPFEEATDPHFDLVARSTVDFLDLALKDAPDGEARLDADVAAHRDLGTLESRLSKPAAP